jgi:hypothetical protein
MAWHNTDSRQWLSVDNLWIRKDVRLSEEKKFPIDRFRDIASWMAEVERRLNDLEAQVKRTSQNSIHDSLRLGELEKFKESLQVILRPPQHKEE